jgi:hypothetical protein
MDRNSKCPDTFTSIINNEKILSDREMFLESYKLCQKNKDGMGNICISDYISQICRYDMCDYSDREKCEKLIESLYDIYTHRTYHPCKIADYFMISFERENPSYKNEEKTEDIIKTSQENTKKLDDLMESHGTIREKLKELIQAQTTLTQHIIMVSDKVNVLASLVDEHNDRQ